MLLVKTFIAPSQIQGIGLFAKECIRTGEKIWDFKDGFDLKIHPQDIETLPLIARTSFLHYCYHSKEGNYILCFDDARFLNHSDQPNVIDDDSEEGIVIAGRDILAGEELTTDYRKYDIDYEKKLGIAF